VPNADRQNGSIQGKAGGRMKPVATRGSRQGCGRKEPDVADLRSTPTGLTDQQDGSANGGARSTVQRTPQRRDWSGRPTRAWLQNRFTIPAGVVVVILILMVSIGANDPGLFDHDVTLFGSGGPGSISAPKVAAMGQSILDGSFVFMVTSAPQKPTKTFTDHTGVTQSAQGVFVIVRVNITNVGYDPRSLPANNQFLINDRGQRYATSAAISSLKGTEQVLVDKINPGQTVNEAPLLFDVTPGTTISSIELHDSATSDGVKIRLF
jgi:hypothetical protein